MVYEEFKERITKAKEERKLLKKDIEKKKDRIESLSKEISDLRFRYGIH